MKLAQLSTSISICNKKMPNHRGTQYLKSITRKIFSDMKKSRITYIENILSYTKRKPSFKHLPCKNLLKEILSLEKWSHTQTEALHFKFTDFSQIRELQCDKPSKKSAASDGSFRAVRNHFVVQWFKAYFICHPPAKIMRLCSRMGLVCMSPTTAHELAPQPQQSWTTCIPFLPLL